MVENEQGNGISGDVYAAAVVKKGLRELLVVASLHATRAEAAGAALTLAQTDPGGVACVLRVETTYHVVKSVVSRPAPTIFPVIGDPPIGVTR